MLLLKVGLDRCYHDLFVCIYHRLLDQILKPLVPLETAKNLVSLLLDGLHQWIMMEVVGSNPANRRKIL